MDLWWSFIGYFKSAGRQCYSAATAFPAILPQRTRLIARERHAPPRPLPEPKYLTIKNCCKLEYVDIPSSGTDSANSPTIILIHGAPGNYRDFRYLIPLLADHPGFRIIAINLPGYGGSLVEKDCYLETVSALRLAEVVLDGIRQLCGSEEKSGDLFFVGHSFGSHTVINMAALNATETLQSGKALKIRGLALISPAGCAPHKSLRMGTISVTAKLLNSGNALAVSAATYFTKFVYTKLLRFPGTSAEPFVSAVIRAATTDFDLIADQAKMLGNLQTSTLIAWAMNDEHIQSEIPEKLAMLCHNGPRLQFASGGHNLQKNRAEPLSSAITKWVENVMSNKSVDKEAIVNLP